MTLLGPADFTFAGTLETLLIPPFPTPTPPRPAMFEGAHTALVTPFNDKG